MRFFYSTRPGPHAMPAPRGAISKFALVAIAAATATLHAQQPAPDLILSNGKIITVDDRFTVAQMVELLRKRLAAEEDGDRKSVV